MIPPVSLILRNGAAGSLVLLLFVPACSKPGTTAGPDPTDAPQSAGPAGPGAKGLRFADVSASCGVLLENVSGDPLQKLAIPETIGQGAAAFDYDRDGLLDLFVANGSVFPPTPPRAEPRPALYRNLGNWRFEDVTEAAGLWIQGWGHGAYAVDFDADGWSDLYLTIFRGPNRFFRNRGDGTFEDAAAAWGGADPGPSTGACFFDADSDGDLDLYVANYVVYDPENPPNGGHPCDWRGLSVSCGPRGTIPAPDSFYENREGTLVEATEAFGFASVKPSYALGVVSGDFDNDGDPDVFVANDSEMKYLFVNEGSRRFREAALEHGVAYNEDGRAQAGMGIEFGDVDNDGRFDVFVTNFSHDSNTLYRNTTTRSGAVLFQDRTYAADLGSSSHPFLSWGTRMVDLDSDGWLDIFIASGHVYPQVDGANLGTSYRQRNQLYRSLGADERGQVRFEEILPAAGDPLALEKVSRGLSVADWDNDGDLDLFTVEMDEAPTLLVNETKGGHWIGFELIGGQKNRDAIGARMRVEDSAGVTRWRELTGGGTYLSTCDHRLVFGLGAAGGALKSAEIRWPSGATASLGQLEVDRYHRVEEPAEQAEQL
jgi:hypothetical protein